MTKIIYLGSSDLGTTSLHRANALRRLGVEVFQYDPYQEFVDDLSSPLFGRLNYRTGFRFLQHKIEKWLDLVLEEKQKPDAFWIDSGELFGVNAVKKIKRYAPVILFNHDDPTGTCYGRRFDSLKNALPLYDLVTAARQESVTELSKICLGKVIYLHKTYDEVAHSSGFIVSENDIPDKFKSDVAFIGTWFAKENRDRFLLDIIESNIDVAIWGNRWNKSPYWRRIQPFYRGTALSGADYVMAIRGAKINIGMTASISRDLHTTRSMEIPYSGGLLCAKRTVDHEFLYADGVEAVLWNDSGECAQICHSLLAAPDRRERIRLAGMARVRKNKVGNEDACREILSSVGLVA